MRRNHTLDEEVLYGYLTGGRGVHFHGADNLKDALNDAQNYPVFDTETRVLTIYECKAIKRVTLKKQTVTTVEDL